VHWQDASETGRRGARGGEREKVEKACSRECPKVGWKLIFNGIHAGCLVRPLPGLGARWRAAHRLELGLDNLGSFPNPAQTREDVFVRLHTMQNARECHTALSSSVVSECNLTRSALQFSGCARAICYASPSLHVGRVLHLLADRSCLLLHILGAGNSSLHIQCK